MGLAPATFLAFTYLPALLCILFLTSTGRTNDFFCVVSHQFLCFCLLLLAARVRCDSWSPAGSIMDFTCSANTWQFAPLPTLLQVHFTMMSVINSRNYLHVHGTGLASSCLAHDRFFMTCKEIPSSCRYHIKINQLQRMPQSFPPFIQPILFKIKQGLKCKY